MGRYQPRLSDKRLHRYVSSLRVFQRREMPNGRCRMHGGKSPGAPVGNKNAQKQGATRPTPLLAADTSLPAGTLAYRFGDDLDSAAKRIIDQQHGAGYKMPFDDDMMIVGLPLGTVRYNNIDWTRIQLPDGREIGIESADLKMVSDVAREFLLAEKRANRSFTDKDRINFNGVPVEFLSWSAQSPTLVTSPLQRKERDWRWALLALSAV